jgi:hypothetical protein
VFE